MHCLPAPENRRFTPSALALGFYVVWIVSTDLLVNPSYTSAGIYHPAFLAAGFMIGNRVDERTSRGALGALVAFGSVLSLWGLWQAAAHGLTRAQAGFETPATLAAVLNLVLLPAIAWLAWGARAFPGAIAVALLCAGELATESRGGLLGLAAGALALAICARKAGLGLSRIRALCLALALGSGLGLSQLAFTAGDWLPRLLPPVPALSGLGLAPSSREEGARFSMIGSASLDSSVSRLDLYETAVAGVRDAPLFGAGYLSFYYALPAARLLPAYGVDEGVTYFVHDDYLQTILELGAPGFVALLALVGFLPFAALTREWPGAAAQPRALCLIGSLSAMVSMAMHAAVDYPFYVPVCLMLFGIACGVADRAAIGMSLAAGYSLPGSIRQTAFGRALRAAAITLGGLLLLAPAAGEAAVWYAKRQWREAQGQSAAFWFEAARRLGIRDWRYDWYAGQFWFAQASAGPHPVAAKLADRAFAAGARHNSRDVHNLIGRTMTQRLFGDRLDDRASPEALRAWAERAVALAPRDRAARVEHVLVLSHIGAADDAKAAAAALLRDYPNDAAVQRFARPYLAGTAR